MSHRASPKLRRRRLMRYRARAACHLAGRPCGATKASRSR